MNSLLDNLHKVFCGEDFIHQIIAASFTITDEIKSGALSSQTSEDLELNVVLAKKSATTSVPMNKAYIIFFKFKLCGV